MKTRKNQNNILTLPFLVFVIVAIIAGFGCSSPTDVQANRFKVIEEDTANYKPFFSVSQQSLYYGYVYLNTFKSYDITITNLKQQMLKIFKQSFAAEKQQYYIDSNYFPIVLAPAGTAGSSKKIKVKFWAKTIGEFRDTLSFDSYLKPTVTFHTIVPSVYGYDLDYGNVKVGESSQKFVAIWNFNPTTIFVKSLVLNDPESAFKFTTEAPFKIEKYKSKYIFVTFRPTQAKVYNASIDFEIEEDVLIDNHIELTGMGGN